VPRSPVLTCEHHQYSIIKYGTTWHLLTYSHTHAPIRVSFLFLQPTPHLFNLSFLSADFQISPPPFTLL
jgi:hypothetical protein